MKSRQGCFSILTEIAIVLPGSLGEHVPALIPGKVLVHLNELILYSSGMVHMIQVINVHTNNKPDQY